MFENWQQSVILTASRCVAEMTLAIRTGKRLIKLSVHVTMHERHSQDKVRNNKPGDISEGSHLLRSVMNP